jgi:hypothetical protein
VDGGAATPETAAAMVTYANVIKGYKVKYWEIGNEPDLYSSMDGGFPIQTAAEYCAQFATYVTAMKAANRAGDGGVVPIQFLGPELSNAYVPGNDWLTPFLDGCKDSVDIVTIHYYPYGGTTDSVPGALSGGSAFQSILTSVAAIVAGHARPNTPFGVTESNISWDWAPTDYTSTSLPAAPGTFNAAVWTADVMGTALQNHLWTLDFWNIGETPTGGVLGFIVNLHPVPAYYTEQMISTNFRGNVLAPTGVPTGFSVYASYDASEGTTAVLVINRTATSSKLTLQVDSLPARAFQFPATSVTLVRIPDASGSTTQTLRYTADLAEAGAPPQAIQ